MLQALLPILSGIAGNVVKSIFPDPADKLKADEAQQKFIMGMVEQANAIENAAASIVRAEAASSHWLAANWRPITMLTFLALIVARWFGFTAPGITEAESLALWNIVQLGLGGYVVGRSAEKILPQIVQSMKK